MSENKTLVPLVENLQYNPSEHSEFNTNLDIVTEVKVMILSQVNWLIQPLLKIP